MTLAITDMFLMEVYCGQIDEKSVVCFRINQYLKKNIVHSESSLQIHSNKFRSLSFLFKDSCEKYFRYFHTPMPCFAWPVVLQVTKPVFSDISAHFHKFNSYKRKILVILNRTNLWRFFLWVLLSIGRYMAE